MKFLALALIVSMLTLSGMGCSSKTASQAASSSELEKYLRDNPVAAPEETYEVQ